MSEQDDLAAELKPCPFCSASLTEPTAVQYPRMGLARLHPGGIADGDCPLSGWGFYDEQLAHWNQRPTQDGPSTEVVERVARLFHDTYESLAPSFGYETRPDTKQFDPESPNGKLMLAVCSHVIASLPPPAVNEGMLAPTQDGPSAGVVRLSKQLGLALEALEAIADSEGDLAVIAQQTMEQIGLVGIEAVFLDEADQREGTADPAPMVEELQSQLLPFELGNSDNRYFNEGIQVAINIISRAAMPPTAATVNAAMLEALEPFAAIRVHKSELGNADAMIGVKISDIRRAKDAYALAKTGDAA